MSLYNYKNCRSLKSLIRSWTKRRIHRQPSERAVFLCLELIGIDYETILYYNVLRKKVKAMVISIRMTEEEKKLADAYAKLNGVSLSEAIKRAYFEKIEDEYDIALADMALREYEKNPKTYSHEEVKKMLGL